MSLWQFGGGPDAASLAMLLAEGLREGPVGAPTPTRPFAVEFGIHGVGLFARGQDVVPALFVEVTYPLDALEARTLAEFPRAEQALDLVFQRRAWPTPVVAVPVPPMSLHADPGDPIQATMLGQLGAPVTWGAGNVGYLTAGHVGGAAGNAVRDANQNQIGTVRLALHPSAGSGSASIDVAVIELSPGVAQGNKLGIASTAVAAARDGVDVHTRSGPAQASIVAYASWFDVSLSNVTVTDVYQTSRRVTQNGDSGGPVLLQRQAGAIIGHVVAGAPATSCIQNVDSQLSAVRNNYAFASIRI